MYLFDIIHFCTFDLNPTEQEAWLFGDLIPVEQEASISNGFVTVHVALMKPFGWHFHYILKKKEINVGKINKYFTTKYWIW